MWRNIIKYSSWYFMVQASTWVILSLLTIIVIEEEMYIKVMSTYSDFLSNSIYAQFLMKSWVQIEELKVDLTIANYIVRGEVTEGFAIIQLILNIVWLITSILINNWLSKNILNPSKLTTIHIWIFIGIVVACADGLHTILIWSDLAEGINAFNKFGMNIYHMISITAIGVVMSIVARGFVLWFINVGLLGILWRKMWTMRTGDMDWLSPKPYIGNTNVHYG